MQAKVKGFLVRDGDLKYTPKGTAIWKSALAIQGRERGKDETVFVDVVAFNGLATALAELEQELKKGALVEVEGRLQTETYEGKKGKTTRVVLLANDVAVVVRRNKDEAKADEADEAEDDLDDLF
jgi:single-strand DNA-binding protein